MSNPFSMIEIQIINKAEFLKPSFVQFNKSNAMKS